jgi:hypothetical protein
MIGEQEGERYQRNGVVAFERVGGVDIEVGGGMSEIPFSYLLRAGVLG